MSNRAGSTRRHASAWRYWQGCFDWRGALVVVQPATMIRWHRAGWRLLWRMKSRAGRPPIPKELRELIRRMARENVLWGEERIANELLLKLGIRISPRTVRKYLPKRPPGRPRGDLRWSTFLKSHARGILACDFFVAVTATFRMLYVLVVIEHGTRRLAHVNVTTHPSAAWTLQQLREVIADGDAHKYLLHDRDSIFAKHLDDSIRAMGLGVLRSPFLSPKANAICERVIGTIRRECLDWMIPCPRRISARSCASGDSLQRWTPAQRVGSRRAGPSAGMCRSRDVNSESIDGGCPVLAKSVLGGFRRGYSLAPRRATIVGVGNTEDRAQRRKWAERVVIGFCEKPTRRHILRSTAGERAARPRRGACSSA